jgi:hypothetical protein
MRAWPWIALLLVGLVACKPKTFPGTTIPDNEDNRVLLKVVAQYQKGMEDRDLDALLDMAAPDYHEDRGTLDQSDDYGIQELRSALAAKFSNIQQMRYSVKVKEIQQEGDEAMINFRYDMAFQFKVGEVARWNTVQEDGQLELKRIDGAWKVRSGL